MNIKKLYHTLQRLCWINIRKTIIVNLKLLPFAQAWRLPIVIYGKCQTKVVNSKLLLDTKPHFDMLSFGMYRDYMSPNSSKSLFFLINSKLHLCGGGNVRFSPGCVLRVQDGLVELGERIGFGNECKLLSNNFVSIGSSVWFAFQITVCDTDYHYIERAGKVRDCVGKVIVGDRCWIANGCLLLKGCVLPDDTIIGSRGVVNKPLAQPGIYAGIPVKLVGQGTRVGNKSLQAKIQAWFKEHDGEKEYILSEEEMNGYKV